MYSAAESAALRPATHALRPKVPRRDEEGAAGSSLLLATSGAGGGVSPEDERKDGSHEDMPLLPRWR